MRKNLLAVFTLLTIATAAGAQTSTPGTGPTPVRDALKERNQNIKEIRQDTRGDVQDLRQDKRGDVKDIRQDTREEFKNTTPGGGARLDVLKQGHAEVEARRAQFRNDMQVKRVEMKDRLEGERDKFKERLKNIKDERKKNLAEKIQNRLHEILGNRVERFTNIIDTIDEVLGRIKSRKEKATANGVDTSSVNDEIAAADAAIAAARAAVTDLADNTYTADVTDEATLRAKINAVKEALKADLAKVHEAIKAARDAVRAAHHALAALRGVDNDPPAATSTPTSTP